MQEEIQGECKKIFVKPEGDCEGTEEIDRQTRFHANKSSFCSSLASTSTISTNSENGVSNLFRRESNCFR